MDLEERKTKARDAFSLYIQSKSGRCTQERMAILDTIVEHKIKFTIEEMMDCLQAKHFHVSLGTLYNTIRELLDAHMVRKIQIGRTAHYQFHDGKNFAFNQICTRCGKVIEFQLPELEDVLRGYRSRRFAIQEYTVTLNGTCSTCQAQLRKKGKKKNN